jgi:hypothetical protein
MPDCYPGRFILFSPDEPCSTIIFYDLCTKKRGIEMRETQPGVIFLIAFILLIAFTSIVYADTGVPAQPEVQGLATGTSANVVGTVTETDSGAWSINAHGIPLSGDDPIVAAWPEWGIHGVTTYADFKEGWDEFHAANPDVTLWDVFQNDIHDPPELVQSFLSFLQNQGSSLTPPLQTQEVQYSAGYNDQYAGISGQQAFTKSMALTTANRIADQSNIKAATSIQFIAVDTGRATRTEDLLLDGASLPQNSSTLILCPFANANPGIIPAFCNIEQAGSAFDTTLTSTVTSADTRFVGTDATIPTVLNYNINAEGITLGNQSSPMIGSVSSYLKVHVQEARNESTTIIPVTDDFVSEMTILQPPVKSEDLVYSETSTASGLIDKFSKSMSYSSQAIAVPVPVQTILNPF